MRKSPTIERKLKDFLQMEQFRGWPKFTAAIRHLFDQKRNLISSWGKIKWLHRKNVMMNFSEK